ncbi:MAG: flavodoxin domain-containing protein [Deltaproteobacteria bacterium]|nr:flavodoxin domain-containing protein [Deltaproteobacteria bacterium]
MEIFLIVGSESGTAEMVGDAVASALEAQAHRVIRYQGGGLEEARLEERRIVLVCTSTTGIGDVPQNIRPLYEALATKRPPLHHLRYGVIGLGDRNYRESFQGAPKKWDALLSELGATRVGTRLELDATDNPTPDEDALMWLPKWLEALEKGTPHTPKQPHT